MDNIFKGAWLQTYALLSSLILIWMGMQKHDGVMTLLWVEVVVVVVVESNKVLYMLHYIIQQL